MSNDEGPIDLFAALRLQGKAPSKPGGQVSARVVVEFTAPTMVWHADANAIAAEVAAAIQETMRSNLMQGLAPDGSAMPASDTDTLERRRYRLAQAQRGGNAPERYTDKGFRSTVRRNWNKRFRAPKLGMAQPLGLTTFGIESGLLARSVVAVAQGGVWRVFFSSIRARLDQSGKSAVLRVFSRIPIWSARAMLHPRIQDALRSVQKKLLSKSVTDALATAAQSVQQIQALQEELDEDG